MTNISDTSFLDDETEDIAIKFDIPSGTAAMWKTNIGKLNELKKVLGRNGPSNYLDLIRQREWAIEDQKQIREEWLKQLSTRYERRADFDYESVFQSEYKEKRQRVKYHMRGIDPAYIEASRNRWEAEKALIKIFSSHLDEVPSNLDTKKEKIIELKAAFPYLRATEPLAAQATHSSVSYVSQFKYSEDDGVMNTKLPKKLKRRTLERDDNLCVRCGSQDDLHVHHVIPMSKGGSHDMDNLAALCDECHRIAHGGRDMQEHENVVGMNYNDVIYDSKDEFWKEWTDELT
jgi:hypothetical protein